MLDSSRPTADHVCRLSSGSHFDLFKISRIIDHIDFRFINIHSSATSLIAESIIKASIVTMVPHIFVIIVI